MAGDGGADIEHGGGGRRKGEERTDLSQDGHGACICSMPYAYFTNIYIYIWIHGDDDFDGSGDMATTTTTSMTIYTCIAYRLSAV